MYPNLESYVYNPSNFNVIYNPAMPVCCSLVGEKRQLEPGLMITVLGRCHPYIEQGSTQSFRVDFFNGECEHYGGGAENIAFHFNPRFENRSGMIIMNSCEYGQWGQEIRPFERPFPFRSGGNFRLTFKVETEHFEVQIDGQHLCQFRHRYNFYNIRRMHISGRLDIDQIKFEMVGGGMPRYIMGPQLPYYEYLPQLSERPHDIAMVGTVRYPFVEYFAINLASSEQGRFRCESEFNNIPIHVSIRAQQGQIVRNTKNYGNWGQEETDLNGPFEFQPGQRFFLMLSIRPDCFSVQINGRFGFAYRHRLSWQSIDSLQIYGSVDLSEIRIQPV